MTLFHRIIDGVFFVLLRYVARYRFKVIQTNLQSSFNYNSDAELISDIMGNYHFLAKILRQFVTKPTRKILDKSLSINKLDILDPWLKENKSVIITLGHVGNWEWACQYMQLKYPDHACALYKQLKSRRINDWVAKRRLAFGGHLIEAGRIGDLLRLMKKKPLLILMIADQNPGSERGIIWAKFFGKNTAFVGGPETLATKQKLPVVYLRNLSDKPDHYKLDFIMLSDGSEVLPHGEITSRYAEALEDNIRLQRTQWLWSHRRWKRVVSSE